MNKNIVLLVDNKQRDLLGVSLVAYHLRSLEIECHLEPLESYRGALEVYRPDMILFNHLTAGHLVAYSQRLQEMGVLTAVLTNEGITYDRDLLRFIVGSHHSMAHVDYFLCWNSQMKSALEELEINRQAQIEVVGIPRFDFYSKPWSKLFDEPRPAAAKARILFCTNFAYADYRDVPGSGEKFFASVKDRVPAFKNYQEIIDVHHQNRLRMFAFLDAIAQSRHCRLILRPHPYERLEVYQDWLRRLPPDQQALITLDQHSDIMRLILNSDLEISCETCTTALEAWIAGKPTIELVFQRHPVFFHQEQAAHNPLCAQPSDLPGLIESELTHPDQPRYQAGRQAHLTKWCHTADGSASYQAAQSIARALATRRTPDWSKLKADDYRRGLKLRLTRKFGLAYHYDPTLSLKMRLFPKKYSLKDFAYRKSIKPGDVTEARRRLEENFGSPPVRKLAP